MLVLVFCGGLASAAGSAESHHLVFDIYTGRADLVVTLSSNTPLYSTFTEGYAYLQTMEWRLPFSCAIAELEN